MWEIVIQGMMLLTLSVLSVIDIRTHRVPKAGLWLLSGIIIVCKCIDFKENELLSLGIALVIGSFFLLLSKITREQIGYGDSWLLCIFGIYYGSWRFVEFLSVFFFLLAIAGILCFHKRKKFPAVPFLFVAYFLLLLVEK